MNYLGHTNYNHDHAPKTGVLITNLGTPDAPTPKAVRRYLAEFLSDPRVVEYPRALWWLILHGIILNIRPRLSAKAYKKIWSTNGSPLLVHSQQLVQQLEKSLASDTVIALGMRYGNPSIEAALEKLRQAPIDKLIVLPLYPQYASATTGSTFDEVTRILKKWRWVPELHFIQHYADQPLYISALAEHIKQYWQTTGKKNHLIFSYHGIPKRTFLAGDPYPCLCQKTSRLVAEKLELNKEEYSVVFQSRFGREEWLKPYCDETLKTLPAKGIHSVDIICPGFSVDCLETLEEIAIQNKALFLEAGGKEYRYIPALNASAEQENLILSLLNSINDR